MSTSKVKTLSVPTKSDRIHGAIDDIAWASLILTVPMLALTLIFLVLVYHYQVPNATGDSAAYLVNYSATRLITISSWTSTAASIILPFAMILLSYPISRSHLVQSTAADGSSLPTPYQLSLLVGMLGGGLGSLWQYILYHFWRRKSRDTAILSAATAGIVGFSILSTAILAADTWLHVTTSTVPYGIVNPSASISMQYGRGLDASCFHAPGTEIAYDVCLKRPGASGPAGGITNAAEAYRTLANLSTINQATSAVIEDKECSFNLPADNGQTIDYDATSPAIHTSCRPISRECDLRQLAWCSFGPNNSYCPTPEAFSWNLSYSCNGGILQGDLAGASGTAFGGFNPMGSSYGTKTNIGFFLQFFNDNAFKIIRDVNTESNHPSHNPLHFITGADIIVSDDLASDPDAINLSTNNSTGLLFGCSSTVYNIEYSFINGSVSNGTATKANDTLVQSIGWVMSDYMSRITFQPYLESAMIAGGQQSNNSQQMANYFARRFSEVSISLAAGILSPRDTLREASRVNMLVARLPKAPFFTLLVLELLYVAFGLALGIWAMCSQPRLTRNVQARLTVAGLVAALFEGEHGPRKGMSIEGLFGEKVGGQEKRVGVQNMHGEGWKFNVICGAEQVEEKVESGAVSRTEHSSGSVGHEAPKLAPIAHSEPLLSERSSDEVSEVGDDARSIRSEVSALTEEESAVLQVREELNTQARRDE